MKKVLVIGSTVVDVVVNLVDHLPKTGEDVHIRSQHMSLGGCAYNVSDSIRHFQVPYILFSPIGTGVYGNFIREELHIRGISSPIPTPEKKTDAATVLWKIQENVPLSHTTEQNIFLKKNGFP